ERALGAPLGELLRAAHERNGVEFLLGRTVAEIGPHSVRTSEGESLDADLVVMGVGVRPDLRLAQAAGLAIDGGVVVDERFQTSVPGIFAAGDIARYPDPLTGTRIRV